VGGSIKRELGATYFLIAKVRFNKHHMSIKVIKELAPNVYFKETNNEKACRQQMLRYLHRTKVDPIMSVLDSHHDLLYVCEAQHRKNYPTIDYKKNLWLYSIDTFKLRNRHNLEETLIQVPDEASKFVMSTHKGRGQSDDDGAHTPQIYYLATPERNKKYIYKYLIEYKLT
jgi:hypothetical protein